MVKLPDRLDPKPPRCLVSATGLAEHADQARFHLVQAFGLEGACEGPITLAAEPILLAGRVVAPTLCAHHARQWSAEAAELRKKANP